MAKPSLLGMACKALSDLTPSLASLFSYYSPSDSLLQSNWITYSSENTSSFYSSPRLCMNTLHFITAVWSGGLIKNHTLQGSKSCTKQIPSLQLCITPSPPLTPFLTLTLNLWTWTSFLSPISPHTMPYLQILTHPWCILWELGSVMGDVRRGVR